MNIVFTKHAENKIELLDKHGFGVTKEQIEDTVITPDKIFLGRHNRKIAQKSLDKEHLLRVIFEKEDKNIKIVTLYPARRKRYANEL